MVSHPPTATLEDSPAIRESGVFGQFAISVPLWLLIAPAGLAGSISLALDGGVPGVGSALGVGLVAELVVGLTYWALHRMPPKLGSGQREAWILATWTAASITRALVTFALTRYLTTDPARETQFDLGLIGLVVAGVPLQALGSYLLTSLTEHRKERSGLTASIQRYEQLSRTSRVHLAEYRARLETTLHQSVAPQIRSLLQELSLVQSSGGRGDLENIARRIDDDVRNEVRRLSHAVAAGTTLPDWDSRPQAMSWRALIVSVMTGPIPVWLTVGLAFCLRLPVELSPGGPGALLRFLTTLLWLLAFIQLTNALRSRIMAHRPVSARVTAGSATYVLLFLGTAAVIAITARIWPVGAMTEWFAGSVPRHLPGALWVVVGALAATAVVAANHQRRADAARLSSVNNKIRMEFSALEAEAQSVRNQLAQVLHGPVQGRLSITSMLLRETQSTAHETPDQRESHMSRIKALLESIESDIVMWQPTQSAVDPWQSAEEFRYLWRGLLETDISLTPDATTVLAGSPPLNTRAFEVIGEAALNASRHGHAHRLTVTINVEGPDRDVIQIQVRNDGTPPSTAVSAGLGSARIQQMGGQWSLCVTEDGWVQTDIALPIPRHS